MTIQYNSSTKLLLLHSAVLAALVTSCNSDNSSESANRISPPVLTPQTSSSSIASDDHASVLDPLLSRIPPCPPQADRSNEWSRLQIHIRKARYLLRRYSPSSERQTLLTEILASAEEALQTTTNSTSPSLVTGLRTEGYYSNNDASFQPFARYIPTSAATNQKARLPLLVYLHGYSPRLDILNWNNVPQPLIDFAERNSYAIAVPFARSNTDFQGIGEQDVFNVISRMEHQFNTDSNRVIIAGYSMGGMGAWSIGARHPNRFAGLIIMCGRGDYYFWQKISRQHLPAYKQQLIDADFGFSLKNNLREIPAYCIHGAKDPLTPVAEARHMVEAISQINTNLTYIELPRASHWIADSALERDDMHQWIKDLPPLDQQSRSSIPAPSPLISMKTAFLSPFIFVNCALPPNTNGSRFRTAALRWYQFSKSYPRMTHQSQLSTNKAAQFNIFLFGEPEDSALIRAALNSAPIDVTADSYVINGQPFPRQHNGLIFTYKSPWNPRKLVVCQIGTPWGDNLSPNHRYDLVPGYIVYQQENDKDGSNTALCAGFFNAQWQISDRPQAGMTKQEP